MESFDLGKFLTGMWSLGGKSFLEAQQQALRAFTGGAGAALDAPCLGFEAAEVTRATQAFADLLAAANALSLSLIERLPRGVETEPTVEATLRRMMDPRAWLSAGDDMEEALQRMAQGPRLADLWDIERRYVKLFQAWATLRRSGLEHQAVVLQGWMDAAQRFTQRVQGLGAEAPLAPRAALDLWVETANKALLETQRSERYLESQARLLKASTEFRLQQQELAEYFGAMFGLPTRTELDDVHRSLTEMRRELRAMEKRLAEATRPAPAMSAAAIRSRAPRRTEKPKG